MQRMQQQQQQRDQRERRERQQQQQPVVVVGGTQQQQQRQKQQYEVSHSENVNLVPVTLSMGRSSIGYRGGVVVGESGGGDNAAASRSVVSKSASFAYRKES